MALKPARVENSRNRGDGVRPIGLSRTPRAHPFRDAADLVSSVNVKRLEVKPSHGVAVAYDVLAASGVCSATSTLTSSVCSPPPRNTPRIGTTS